MWAAVTNRNGELCALAVATDDGPATWPGSRGIAIAKAFTANAFSSDTAPLSTARLYTLSQPGHSLWGAANGNPFNPLCAGERDRSHDRHRQVCGGTITFGGGLALYQGPDPRRRPGRQRRYVVHRPRDRQTHARSERPGPSRPALRRDRLHAVDGPSPFAHPLCPNTFRDGKKVGDEAPAQGY